jgi:hypothetical protein
MNSAARQGARKLAAKGREKKYEDGEGMAQSTHPSN